MIETNGRSASLSQSDSSSSSGENDVEIHSENTGIGIVFNTQINMFLNTEPEISYFLKNKHHSPSSQILINFFDKCVLAP